jgi:hypothetical protein
LQFQTEDSPVFHPECKLTICLVFDILIVSWTPIERWTAALQVLWFYLGCCIIPKWKVTFVYMEASARSLNTGCNFLVNGSSIP